MGANIFFSLFLFQRPRRGRFIRRRLQSLPDSCVWSDFFACEVNRSTCAGCNSITRRIGRPPRVPFAPDKDDSRSTALAASIRRPPPTIILIQKAVLAAMDCTLIRWYDYSGCKKIIYAGLLGEPDRSSHSSTSKNSCNFFPIENLASKRPYGGSAQKTPPWWGRLRTRLNQNPNRDSPGAVRLWLLIRGSDSRKVRGVGITAAHGPL